MYGNSLLVSAFLCKFFGHLGITLEGGGIHQRLYYVPIRLWQYTHACESSYAILLMGLAPPPPRVLLRDLTALLAAENFPQYLHVFWRLILE